MQAREHHYNTAMQNLDALLTQIQFDHQKNDLYRAGKEIYDLCATYQAPAMPDQRLADMTDWINGVTDVIRNPIDNQALARHITHTDAALAHSNKYKWLKILGGAMLTLFGVALFTGSCLMLPGMIFAVPALLVTATAKLVYATSLLSLIATTFMGGAYTFKGALFAHDSYKGKIKIAGEELETCAYRRSEAR
jgi:hypothetical protein